MHPGNGSAHAKTNAEPDAKTNAGTNPEPFAEADTEPDAKTNAGTHPEPNAEPDTAHTEPNTCANLVQLSIAAKQRLIEDTKKRTADILALLP